MYAYRLCEALGLGEDGLVRVSFVHYNTVDDVRAVIQALDAALC